MVWQSKHMNLPLPVLDWMRRYDRHWLRSDAVAGITLGAYLLPGGLGDSSLANLPPRWTLRLLVWRTGLWLFCGSEAITVTSLYLCSSAHLGEIVEATCPV